MVDLTKHFIVPDPARLTVNRSPGFPAHGRRILPAGGPQFRLRVYNLEPRTPLPIAAGSSVLCTKGALWLTWLGGEQTVAMGQTITVPADVREAYVVAVEFSSFRIRMVTEQVTVMPRSDRA